MISFTGVIRARDVLLVDPDGPNVHWTEKTIDQWTSTYRSKLFHGARTEPKRLLVRFRDPRKEKAVVDTL